MLKNRADFDAHFQKAAENYSRLTSGEQWVISVGMSECSKAKGAQATYDNLRLQLEMQQVTAELRIVGCGGWCWAEPFITVVGPDHPLLLYGNMDSDRVPDLVSAVKNGTYITEWVVGTFDDKPFEVVQPLSSDPFFSHQHRVLSKNWGLTNPLSIDEYIANGGYSAWIKALFDMSPEEVIEDVKASGVRGRGGAGFPAGIKWEGGRRSAAEPKFIACNSHEGEPNVYKDRRLLESEPHVVLEGMLIGCYAVGSQRAYNYIGGEHILAVERFRHAVAQAYDLGLLGENILGTGIDIEMRVSTGGGAYICGEGSALMYSVMGERGQPRTKPPRSVEEGLWKRPTVLNNTETFAAIPSIIRNGGEWYAGLGTERSSGTKLITMQGALKRLGVVEIELGMPLKQLIFEVYGGMQPGREFRAVQTGGVSAFCLSREQLALQCDFESMSPANAMLGSGGFVIVDDTVDPVEFARYLMDFNRWESCSKCTPCRLGNKALVEIIDRILNGDGRPGDLELIERTSAHVMELSLCGLGQVAPMPLLGVMKAFPEAFESYIDGAETRKYHPIPLLAVN